MLAKPLVRSILPLALTLLIAPLTATNAAAESPTLPNTSTTVSGSAQHYEWNGKIYLNGKLSSKESIDSLSITGGNYGSFSKVDGSYSVKLPADAKILTFCYTSRGDAPYNTNSNHCIHVDTSNIPFKTSEIPNNYDLNFLANSGKIITGSIVSPAKKVNGAFPTTYVKVYGELGIMESMNVFGNKYQISIPSAATRITFCQKDMDCIEQNPEYLSLMSQSTAKVTYNPSFKKAKPGTPSTVITPKPIPTTTVITPKPGTQAQKAATDLAKSLNKVWKSNLSPSEVILLAVESTPYVQGVTINTAPFLANIEFYDVIANDGFRCVVAKPDGKRFVFSVENSDCKNYINIMVPDYLKNLLKYELYLYNPIAAAGIGKYTPALIQKFGAIIKDKNLLVSNKPKGISVTLVGKADVVVLLESDSKGKLVATNTKPGIQAQKSATDLANSLNKIWNKDISSDDLILQAVRLTPYVQGVTINSFPYFMDIIMYDVIAADGFRCVAAKFIGKKVVYSVVNSDCKNFVNIDGAEGLKSILYYRLYIYDLWAPLTKDGYTPGLIQKFGATIKDKNLVVTNTTKGISVTLAGKADVVVLMESDSNGKLLNN